MPIPRSSKGPRPVRARRRAIAVLCAAAAFGGLAGLVLLQDDGLGAAARTGTPPAAEPAATVAADAAPALPSLGPSLGGLWAVLAVFVVLGVATILVARRAGGRRVATGAVHLVDTLPLGGRRMIHLVRCGPRRYLIGNSEQGIQYLASLPAEAHERAVDDAAADGDEAAAGGEPPFASLLRGVGRPS
jgi:flagellar biogenesis protein FliO